MNTSRVQVHRIDEQVPLPSRHILRGVVASGPSRLVVFFTDWLLSMIAALGSASLRFDADHLAEPSWMRVQVPSLHVE